LLRQVFVEADADGSGRLDFDEFKEVMIKLDPGISVTRVSHMFRELVSRELDSHRCHY
jgi:Ca2+-binding EF-hand superfamily protein